MLLEAIEAKDLRNLSGKINFSAGLNIFVGENGQGKTNWLEAIGLLAVTRSFRTNRLTEAICFGKKQALVTGSVRESEEIVRRLTMLIEPTRRSLAVNDKKETTAAYMSNIHAVVFTADELDIIRGGPENRRRFLDEGIVSLHPPFVKTFADFTRVIKQKNTLLQKAQDTGESLDKTAEALEPWNLQLISLASRIHRGRVRYVERINASLKSDLFHREEMSIEYRSSLEGKGDLANYDELIAERLKVRLQAEIAAGYSLIGPHRDDLDITFDGHDIRKYGSSGQQRSALLLLQLANIEVFRATRGEYPLFLIDDIDAELDYNRIGQLLEYLDGKTQTFVTTSKDSFVEQFGQSASIFKVSDGKIEIQ